MSVHEPRPTLPTDGDSLEEPESVDDVLRAIARAPARRPPLTPEAGSRWGDGGRYVIGSRLGRGGMGAVYLATDTLLGRQVALKVLDAGNTVGDPYRARLLREARLAAQVESERVARVYDVGEHEGNAFVAMEYIRGVTLREWMARPRSPAEILTVATQMSEGLAALHSSAVIHRDLKPENVMLSPQGALKLVDFGLAGYLTGPGEPAGAPSPGDLDVQSSSAFVGTPGYMAPEQYAGEAVDARADIFAFGVVICELVTGERPFKGATMPALLRAIEEHPVALEEPAWRRFPAILGSVTARMLERRPEARFEDGADVARALGSIGASQAGEPARASSRPGLWKEPELRDLASKVSRFWLDNVLARRELEGILPQRRTVDFSFVKEHWERNYRAMHDAVAPVVEVFRPTPEVFEDVGRVLLIVGDPGCGKTLNLLLIARHLFEGAEGPDAPVPVVFNLSTWRRGVPLGTWLVQELGSLYQVPRHTAEALVTSNRLALLLDALDEVPSSERADCVAAIDAFVAEARPPAVVVTARVEACRALPARLALNAALQIHPLTPDQLASFLGTRPAATMQRMQSAFEADPRLLEMARTPLLLSLLTRVCENDATPLSPSKRVGAAICELYVSQVASRSSLDRPKLEELEAHLGWVARALVRENRAVFRVEDVQPRWLRTGLSRWVYAFASRLVAAGAFGFSTFFAIGYTPLRNGGFQSTPSFALALALVGTLTTALVYAALALAGWAPAGLSVARRLSSRSKTRAGAFGVALVSGALIAAGLSRHAHPAVSAMAFQYALLASVALGFSRPGDERDVGMHERRSWSASALRRRAVWVAVAVVAVAGAIGVGSGLVAAAIAAVVLSAGGLVLAGIQSDPIAREDHTNAGIHATLANSAKAFGVVFALVTAAFGLVYGLPYGLAVGLSLATLAGLRFGGVDALYHYTLRLALFAERSTCFEVSRPLDAASDTGLLRKLGGGYIFMHRLLLEYYAERPGR